MENTILRCQQCNELFCPTHYDSYPTYDFDEESKSVREIEMDDQNVFRTAHEGHKISELHVINGSFCSHHAYWEPVREDYVLATDDSQTYTIRRWRKDIDEPLRYQIVNLQIEFGKPYFQVQSSELKKQMIADANTLKLDGTKIEQFVESFGSFVSSIKLEDTLECGLAVNDPMVTYAALKDETIETFLNYCYSMFTHEELKRLRIFIDENSSYDDVMNVRVIRSFRLIPTNKRFIPNPAFPLLLSMN